MRRFPRSWRRLESIRNCILPGRMVGIRSIFRIFDVCLAQQWAHDHASVCGACGIFTRFARVGGPRILICYTWTSWHSTSPAYLAALVWCLRCLRCSLILDSSGRRLQVSFPRAPRCWQLEEHAKLVFTWRRFQDMFPYLAAWFNSGYSSYVRSQRLGNFTQIST